MIRFQLNLSRAGAYAIPSTGLVWAGMGLAFNGEYLTWGA